MEIQKELSSISWLVSEEVYRADSALSYSTLSTYESLGFSGLDHLFDKKETPSLTLGSAVDSILTGGMDEFNDRFTVFETSLTDSGIEIVKALIAKMLPYTSFYDIPESTVSLTAKEIGFWKGDKWDGIRYKKVLETGNIADFYKANINSQKTIIDEKTYQSVLACVNTLKESPATRGYFANDDPFSSIRRYYQLKFKATFDNVDYRNMADLIVVDYDKKAIYPCDLKTSSTPEWEFEKSFIKWHYYIQAVLYWKIIRANMDADPYFKDFTLEDYRFIVINPKTLTPLVWQFPLTQCMETLVDDNGNEWRSPFELGKELKQYLDNRPQVPNGINLEGLNTINCLKLKNNLIA